MALTRAIHYHQRHNLILPNKKRLFGHDFVSLVSTNPMKWGFLLESDTEVMMERLKSSVEVDDEKLDKIETINFGEVIDTGNLNNFILSAPPLEPQPLTKEDKIKIANEILGSLSGNSYSDLQALLDEYNELKESSNKPPPLEPEPITFENVKTDVVLQESQPIILEDVKTDIIDVKKPKIILDDVILEGTELDPSNNEFISKVNNLILEKTGKQINSLDKLFDLMKNQDTKISDLNATLSKKETKITELRDLITVEKKGIVDITNQFNTRGTEILNLKKEIREAYDNTGKIPESLQKELFNKSIQASSGGKLKNWNDVQKWFKIMGKIVHSAQGKDIKILNTIKPEEAIDILHNVNMPQLEAQFDALNKFNQQFGGSIDKPINIDTLSDQMMRDIADKIVKKETNDNTATISNVAKELARLKAERDKFDTPEIQKQIMNKTIQATSNGVFNSWDDVQNNFTKLLGQVSKIQGKNIDMGHISANDMTDIIQGMPALETEYQQMKDFLNKYGDKNNGINVDAIPDNIQQQIYQSIQHKDQHYQNMKAFFDKFGDSRTNGIKVENIPSNIQQQIADNITKRETNNQFGSVKGLNQQLNQLQNERDSWGKDKTKIQDSVKLEVANEVINKTSNGKLRNWDEVAEWFKMMGKIVGSAQGKNIKILNTITAQDAVDILQNTDMPSLEQEILTMKQFVNQYRGTDNDPINISAIPNNIKQTIADNNVKIETNGAFNDVKDLVQKAYNYKVNSEAQITDANRVAYKTKLDIAKQQLKQSTNMDSFEDLRVKFVEMAHTLQKLKGVDLIHDAITPENAVNIINNTDLPALESEIDIMKNFLNKYGDKNNALNVDAIPSEIQQLITENQVKKEFKNDDANINTLKNKLSEQASQISQLQTQIINGNNTINNLKNTANNQITNGNNEINKLKTDLKYWKNQAQAWKMEAHKNEDSIIDDEDQELIQQPKRTRMSFTPNDAITKASTDIPALETQKGITINTRGGHNNPVNVVDNDSEMPTINTGNIGVNQQITPIKRMPNLIDQNNNIQPQSSGIDLTGDNDVEIISVNSVNPNVSVVKMLPTLETADGQIQRRTQMVNLTQNTNNSKKSKKSKNKSKNRPTNINTNIGTRDNPIYTDPVDTINHGNINQQPIIKGSNPVIPSLTHTSGINVPSQGSRNNAVDLIADGDEIHDLGNITDDESDNDVLDDGVHQTAGNIINRERRNSALLSQSQTDFSGLGGQILNIADAMNLT